MQTDGASWQSCWLTSMRFHFEMTNIDRNIWLYLYHQSSIFKREVFRPKIKELLDHLERLTQKILAEIIHERNIPWKSPGNPWNHPQNSSNHLFFPVTFSDFQFSDLHLGYHKVTWKKLVDFVVFHARNVPWKICAPPGRDEPGRLTGRPERLDRGSLVIRFFLRFRDVFRWKLGELWFRVNQVILEDDGKLWNITRMNVFLFVFASRMNTRPWERSHLLWS